jgi:hypothetical protein
MNAITPRLIDNSRRLGHESQTVAFAIELATAAPAHSLCCQCAERVEGDAFRLPRGGECSRCPYVGHDCLVVIPCLHAR